MAETRQRDEFMAGYLIAVSNLMNLHDEPVQAEDLLREAQVNRNILKGMGFGKYDLEPLNQLFDEIERKDALPAMREAQLKGGGEND